MHIVGKMIEIMHLKTLSIGSKPLGRPMIAASI